MLNVVEKFFSIQGEGPYSGNPSIFVRLGGCTLTCEGFGCSMVSPKDGETIIKGCDSIYAVNAKHFKHTWESYSDFYALVQEIEKLLPSKDMYLKPDIVFTGGEPTMYCKDDVMIDTITYFISRGYRVTFETNATVDIDFSKYDILKKCNFVMSVKLANSGEPEFKRIKPEIINKILKETEYSCFKFVVNKEMVDNDLSEIFEILHSVPFYADVYLMPLGEDTMEIDSNIISVAEACVKFGFKLSDRMHVRVWGNTMGT